MTDPTDKVYIFGGEGEDDDAIAQATQRAEFAIKLTRWANNREIPLEEFAYICGLSIIFYREVCKQVHEQDVPDIATLGERLAQGVTANADILAAVIPKDDAKH
jgi:hypothetical protein